MGIVVFYTSLTTEVMIRVFRLCSKLCISCFYTREKKLCLIFIGVILFFLDVCRPLSLQPTMNDTYAVVNKNKHPPSKDPAYSVVATRSNR